MKVVQVVATGVVVVGYIFMVVMNALSTLVPFNGKTNANVSDAFPTKFTPAGYAFSIWGLIYFLLGCFTIFQALPRNTNLDVAVKFVVFFNMFLNGVWGVAFAYEVLWLSIVIMLGILGSLLFIYLRLRIGYSLGFIRVYADRSFKEEQSETVKEALLKVWLIEIPFSIYLGWISVATIANFAILFVSVGWHSWESGWSVIVQLVAFGLGTAMLVIFLDVSYSCVIIWALYAISVNHQDDSVVYIASIVFASTLSALTLGIFIWRMIRFHKFVNTSSTASL